MTTRDFLDRQTPGARAIHRGAFENAFRLGHPYVGSEHFLLALVGADHPAGHVLRAHGLTPERVEWQVTRLSGGGLFGDLDRDALAAVGVDVESVVDSVTRSLGPEALHRATRSAFPIRRARWWDPRRAYVGPGMQRHGVFLPIRPGSGGTMCLHQAHLEAQARHDSQIDVPHLALGMLSATKGLAPAVLSALDVRVEELRAALSALP
ncbi:MAG TPA: Clp protease N-terminal domain-containing protein [Trebonia sp.]|jgi:ATP-dependent Clp protease ATP-binding subunit ClpA